MAYEASSTIQADPDAIWTILVDGDAYTSWDSGIEKFEGRIALGEKLSVTSQANPGRAFGVSVTAFDPGVGMTWTGGLPLGLFTGVRTFRLEPQPDNSTLFTMREEYRGILAPLFQRMIPDLAPSFEQFANGLKARVESPT